MNHPCIDIVYNNSINKENLHIHNHEKVLVTGIISCLISNQKRLFFYLVASFENNRFISSCARLYKTIWLVKILKQVCKRHKRMKIINEHTLVDFEEIPTAKIIASSETYPLKECYIRLEDSNHAVTLFHVYELQKLVVESLLQHNFGIANPKIPTNPYTKIPFSTKNLHELYSRIHPLLVDPIMKQYENTGFCITCLLRRNLCYIAIKKYAEYQQTEMLFGYVRHAVIFIFAKEICIRCLQTKAKRVDLLKMFIIIFQYANYKNTTFDGIKKELAYLLSKCNIFIKSKCEHTCRKKFGVKKTELTSQVPANGLFVFGESSENASQHQEKQTSFNRRKRYSYYKKKKPQLGKKEGIIRI